ncbi:MAG: hypothetical protein ACO3EZ_14065 [Prochlorotrichaceae cyanobacterium]
MNPDFWIEINRRDDTQTHLPIPGQVATDSQILADTQSYPVPGAVRYPTINRPRRKQC